MKTSLDFVNSIVKSREKFIVRTAVFNRMTEAQTAEEAFAVLRETGFGGEGDFTMAQYNDLVKAERKKLFDFVKENEQSQKYLDFFFAKEDFFNAECLVRAKFVKDFVVSDLLDGTVAVSDIRKYLDGESNDLAPHVKKPVDEAVKAFESGDATGTEISLIFTKAYYGYYGKKFKSKPLSDFIKHEIDCKNLGTALRTESKEELDRQFIGGGRLSLDDVMQVQTKNREAAFIRYAYTDKYDLIKVVMEEQAEKGTLVAFETAAAGYPLKVMKRKKYDAKGHDIMLLYWLYRENELKNVRVVMSGKIVGASATEIKRRFRENYDG